MESTTRPVGTGLTVVAGLARIAQGLNFAPVGALSLFAGARLRGWRAYALPLALMAVTDPLVGGYSTTTPFVYAAFLINVWVGSRFLRGTENPLRIGSAAAIGSLQFFLISNFGMWLTYPATYAHTLSGLAACYTAAIPFYGRTLAADLTYSAVLFGLHAWLSRRVARAELVAQAA